MRTRGLSPKHFRGWYYDPQLKFIGNDVENFEMVKKLQGVFLIEVNVCFLDSLGSSSPEAFCCSIVLDWSISQPCRF